MHPNEPRGEFLLVVRSEAIRNELFFKSGASAESAAIRLAQGWATAGESAQVEIYIRDGTLARRFVVPCLRAARSPPRLTEPA